jgi:cystathionine gamma-lyase
MSKTKNLKNKELGFATKAIHIGNDPDPSTGSVIPPIFQTSTFAQTSPGEHQGYEYSRSHNPTRTRLEECLASLENTKYCISTASGISAAMLIMHLFPKGSKILCGDDVYGGTYRLFTTVFNTIHNFVFVNTTDLKSLEKNIKEHKPALLWLETPTNPLLKITDIEKACLVAKRYKCKTIVDNTFATPAAQNPVSLGSDFVLHSITKYINGHSDVVGGAIMLNSKKNRDHLFKLQNSTGPCPSPFDSWLALRGVKTLEVRIQRTTENALKIAKFLESHPKVEKVVYPGLKSHPQYRLSKKQMKYPGGMITFFLKGGLSNSKKFLKSVKLFALAESLGGVESLIEHPAIMTHASIPKEVRQELGIFDNLIRVSVGIENAEDLIDDLELALSKA